MLYPTDMAAKKEQTPIEKVVGIYCRISDDRRHDESGVERQEEACRKYAKEKGWRVSDVYIDNDISATQTKKSRPQYQRLMADLKNGNINTVVVWAIDRLYRRPIQLEELLDTIKDRPNISVHAVQGADIRLETSDGQAMARVLVALAKRETDLLTARIISKHQQLADEGKPHGGARTFGYKANQIEINKEEAKIVKQMMAKFLATKNLTSIVVWLNENKVKTARGGDHWTRKTVSSILKNPRIAGYRSHYGKLTKAKWPAIVSVSDWEQAKIILEDPSRKTYESKESKYLLTGLVYCGTDQLRMGNMTRGKKLYSTNTYACRKDPALNMQGCGCRMYGAWVDEFVTTAALERLKNDKKLLKGLATNKSSASAKHIKELNNQLNLTYLRMNETREIWEKGVITTKEFEKLRTNQNSQEQNIKQQIAKINALAPVQTLTGSVNLEKSWEERTLEEKRALLKLIIEKVYIYKSTTPGRNTFDASRIEIKWRE